MFKCIFKNCTRALIYFSEPLKVLCFFIWYSLVHTGTKYMTSTHVHSLNKQNCRLSRLDFFFGGSCEDIVRLIYIRGDAKVLLQYSRIFYFGGGSEHLFRPCEHATSCCGSI